jgi:hypothetical protein
MRQELIIDDGGRARNLGEPGLARSYCSDMESSDFAAFAVRNLGFVHAICTSGRWNVRIRPKVVSPAAIVGTIVLLAERGAVSGSISTLSEGRWHDEIAGSFERLLARLSAYDRRALSGGSRRFISRACKLVGRSDVDPLHRVLAACAVRQGEDPQAVAAFCGPLVEGRVTLAEADDGESFVVRHTGTGYRVYDQLYLKSSFGRRIDDDPDMAYGQWLASSYRSALSNGEAMVHQVDAIIRGARNGLERVCYRRLMVPLSAARGRRFVLSASVLDDTVDLRAAAD